MHQLLLDLLPDLTPAIANFSVGGNHETLSALFAWLSPQSSEPTFFLWGETGSGKSHLLQASDGLYLDAGVDPSLANLPAQGCAASLLAVDQVTLLDSAGQVVLFNFFNALKSGRLAHRLLVADRCPPAQLHDRLREDLRTRLGSALIYRLYALTETEKRAALAAKAKQRGILLPDEALTYLFDHAPRDMRTLSGLIEALDQYSLIHQRPVTMPLLREVMRRGCADG